LPSEEVKQGVRQTVESQFSQSNTGIHFVGWKNCSQTAEGDVVLLTSFVNSEGFIEGNSSIGHCSPANDFGSWRIWPRTVKPYVFFNFYKQLAVGLL